MIDRLERPRLRARRAGSVAEEPVTGSGSYTLGGVEVELAATADGWDWSVASDGRSLTSVSLVWDAGAVGQAPKLFRNGYQSWSPTSVARLGVDPDPSSTAGAPSLVRSTHHADPAVAIPGELRSELVTILDLDLGGPLLMAGFDGGTEHDGTLRARLVDGRVEVVAEAYLGDAEIDGRRRLHGVHFEEGDRPDGPELLAGWADRVGAAGKARTGAPYQVGWCSWYHYFTQVGEADVRANLARAADWPFDVFQVDDGYQPHIGDWLTTNDRFGSSLAELATAIAADGRTPGIWLAPFLVAPDSSVVAEHPDWVAQHASGRNLVGMSQPAWGGHVWVLDTTRPEVLDHIEATARTLVDWGFTYLKADFTYAPSVPGAYADRSATPAQRVRWGMEALRRGAGDDAFLLGCGLPLGAGVGVVDGMRIGPDVAPRWQPSAGQFLPLGYEGGEPATVNAWRNTLTRSAFHRRLWLTTRTASCCARPKPTCRRMPLGRGRWRWASQAAWPSSPTTWPCSTRAPAASLTR